MWTVFYLSIIGILSGVNFPRRQWDEDSIQKTSREKPVKKGGKEGKTEDKRGHNFRQNPKLGFILPELWNLNSTPVLIPTWGKFVEFLKPVPVWPWWGPCFRTCRPLGRDAGWLCRQSPWHIVQGQSSIGNWSPGLQGQAHGSQGMGTQKPSEGSEGICWVLKTPARLISHYLS